MFSHEFQSRPRSVNLRVTNTITRDLILSLCAHLQAARTYYHVDRINIYVDSPGGDIHALLYFVRCMRAMQSAGLLITTHTRIGASSAGAIMLSAGSPGFRTADTAAQLLFHNVYPVRAEGTPAAYRHAVPIPNDILDAITTTNRDVRAALTPRQVDSQDINRVHGALSDLMANGKILSNPAERGVATALLAVASVPGHPEDTWAIILDTLFNFDVHVTPAIPLALGLIDGVSPHGPQ